MRKPLIVTLLIGGFISLYIFYPIAHLHFSKNTFTNLVRECEKSKDLQS